MRRAFGFDVLACARCGGRLRLIALLGAADDQGVVRIPASPPSAGGGTLRPPRVVRAVLESGGVRLRRDARASAAVGGRAAPRGQHAHAFHMRYYHSALAAAKLQRVSLATPAGERPFYRVAASAHYEVEHTNPNHADVAMCPICGRTGEYADLRGNLVEVAHDPLGVERLFNRTIRNEVVRFEDDQQEVRGLRSARDGDPARLRLTSGCTIPLSRWRG